MTVGELKEELQDIPDDFVVTCTVDDGGFKLAGARVYEAIDAFVWKSFGGDEFRIVHSDDTIF